MTYGTSKQDDQNYEKVSVYDKHTDFVLFAQKLCTFFGKKQRNYFLHFSMTYGRSKHEDEKYEKSCFRLKIVNFHTFHFL